MSNTQSIGFFDSGVGGTSIWKEAQEILPNEHTIYLADSKHAPYGFHSKDRIVALCEKNVEFLLEQNCKTIVVACNTATTNAISHLRAKYKLPFVGIEPAIKPAALQSKTKNVGVLATKGTLTSALFHKTFKTYGEGIRLIERVGEGLVPLVENGKIDTAEVRSLLEAYLLPMLQQKIDHLVLGCTHYPYLIDVIRQILPDEVQIIDSGMAVAKQLKNVLLSNELRTDDMIVMQPHRFYTNADNVEVLYTLLGESYDYMVMYKDF
ncbi:MAG: glutamate racemase [Flavobacteriaceae bacterium]|nr:glutamate racemase [Flavobacteriaceae bacterium]